MEVIKVSSFDGTAVWLDQKTELFEVGNFLGGGAAGNVYECEHVQTHERFALKILNPLGYKILSPSLLRRCNIVMKGKIYNDNNDNNGIGGGGIGRLTELLRRDHIWWVVNGTTKQYLACYYSEKQAALRELSLSQCIEIFGLDNGNVNEEAEKAVNDLTNIRNNIIPTYPPKFLDFLRKRNKIFREIRNMRKISNHRNVIRLEGVLELIQESKSTLFLVMELANGGELFDRIKVDCGTREETAKIFFKQLLEGVKHCHDQGVCHRDLKPENLLLQDEGGTNGTILKVILPFHFFLCCFFCFFSIFL
jgi:serine/threonine protein kinase